MPSEPESVPTWALGVIERLAGIQARVDALPAIERDLDQLRKDSVPLSEHHSLMIRVDRLWDISNSELPTFVEMKAEVKALVKAQQQLEGTVKDREVRARNWRWLLATAMGLLALVLAWLNSPHLHLNT